MSSPLPAPEPDRIEIDRDAAAAAARARAPAGLTPATDDASPPTARGRSPRPAAEHRPGAALGIVFVVASAICFGTLPIFARLAYASGADTSTVLLLRFSIAAAVMWIVLRLRGAALPRGRGLVMLIGMGGIGYAGQAYSYFTAVDLGSAGLAALLLYLYPAVVAILSRLLFHHPLTRLQALAIGMALLGSLLTIGRAGDGTPLGVLFGVLAALIYSAYILTGARLPVAVTPTASATVVTSSAAVVYAAVVLARGAHPPRTPLGWSAVLGLALVCTVLAVALFLAGLERLGAVRASVYSTLEPATTLILAAGLLGEEVSWLRAVGGALILAAVVLLARGER
jgi:drug/metabolite transporter (DMT)-like permease